MQTFLPINHTSCSRSISSSSMSAGRLTLGQTCYRAAPHQRLSSAGRCHVRTPTQAQAQTQAPSNSMQSGEPAWDFGYSLEQGPRDTMEDAVISVEDVPGGFFLTGVFDGHGGSTAVEWLESEFYPMLASVLAKDKSSKNGVNVTATHMHQLFANVDKTLLAFMTGRAGEEDICKSGATATIALLREKWLLVANIGDCKAMLCRKGQPVVLTEDHRVYGFGPSVDAEIDRVTAAGGWIVDGRVCNSLAVSRSFGDWELKGEGLKHMLQAGVEEGLWTEQFASAQNFSADPVVCVPQVTEVELVPEDEFLVVATDGLWDFMPPLDVLRWARREFKAGRTPEEVADSLTALALKRYTADNVSVVVVDLKGRESWTAKPPKAKRQSMFGFLNKKK